MFSLVIRITVCSFISHWRIKKIIITTKILMFLVNAICFYFLIRVIAVGLAKPLGWFCEEISQIIENRV